MARKLWLDRLIRRTGYKNETYSALVRRILAVNSEKAANRSAEQTRLHWQRIGEDSRLRRLVIPDVEDALPSKQVYSLKSAQNGKIITDTLHDRISGNLRDTLQGIDTSKPIPAAKFTEMKKRLRETMETYTKRDPTYGRPLNVNTIATTEIGSAVNLAKHEFAKAVKARNPDATIMKRWKHTTRHPRGYLPRQAHLDMNGALAPLDEAFKVPDSWSGGFTHMQRPHDPSAPAYQNINCLCELTYTIKWRKK